MIKFSNKIKVFCYHVDEAGNEVESVEMVADPIDPDIHEVAFLCPKCRHEIYIEYDLSLEESKS